MTLEITRPETEARIQRYLRSGHFHDLDELLTKALDTNIISEYNRDKRPNPGVVKWIERSSNGLRTICRSGLPDEFSLSTRMWLQAGRDSLRRRSSKESLCLP